MTRYTITELSTGLSWQMQFRNPELAARYAYIQVEHEANLEKKDSLVFRISSEESGEEVTYKVTKRLEIEEYYHLEEI